MTILSDATNLDVFNAHYSFSEEGMGVLDVLRNQGVLPRRGIFVRILAFFWRWGCSCFKRKENHNRDAAKNGIMAPYFSNNQYVAVQPVVEHLDGAFLVRVGDDPALSFDSFRCRLISLFFLFYAIQDLCRATPYQRIMMSYYFDEYWNSYGYYVLCRLYLRTYKPRALLVSNDHSLRIRTVVLAARDASVPTVYIQHAAISNTLPPLMFDYAFLEGSNSLKQCLKNGETNTEIYVSGIPRMDFTAKNSRTRKTIERLGVAVSFFDDLLTAKELCQRLKSRFLDKRLILRPHPGLGQHFDNLRTFCCDLGIEFSDPEKESATDYLCRLDVLIAGESNIHLEATLQNILSLYFPLGGERRDHYGFLDSKMVHECKTVDQVVAQIDQAEGAYPNVRSRAQGFCATVNTRWDGHSTELIAETLTNIFFKENDKRDLEKQWVGSAECHHAYEPRNGRIGGTVHIKHDVKRA